MIRRALLALAAVAGLASAQFAGPSPFVKSPAGTSSWTPALAGYIATADTTFLYVGPAQKYTTIDGAITAATARNKPTVIEIDPAGTYASAGGTWPAIWIEIRGNGAVVTNSSPITVTSSYRAYDLNVVGNVVYNGASTDRYYLTGGSRTGNVTLTQGLLHDEGTSLLSGTITVNGGTFECISTTITSTISHTAGNLLLQNTNVNATKSTALITSTATSTSSSFQIVNSLVTNLGTGTAIDISGNTQATAAANSVANVIFTTASAASVIGGTAKLAVSDCQYTFAPTGTGYTGTNWGLLGNRTIATGSTITGTATASVYPFYAYNSSTGIGYYVYNSSTGKGFAADNASSGKGFNAYNSSTGIGYYVYNSSTGNGVYADNASSGDGLYAHNSSTGSGVAARFENAGTGISLSVQGATVFDPTVNSASVTLYKYSNNKQVFSVAATVTLDAGAIAAYCNFELLTRNVALTLTTSGGGAIIYKGAAAAASVTLPATQSSWEIKTDGAYVYIQ